MHDLPSLRAAWAAGARPTFRFFWSHRQPHPSTIGDFCFSQWFPCHFELDGTPYCSTEQWMMASKARLFGDRDTEAQILAANDPRQIKALGRRVQGFVESTWDEHRFGLVMQGNLAKFSQNRKLHEHIISTGDDVLVEASPLDCIWGIGFAHDAPEALDLTQWRGLNLLGFALMQVRDLIPNA